MQIFTLVAFLFFCLGANNTKEKFEACTVEEEKILQPFIFPLNFLCIILCWAVENCNLLISKCVIKIL